MTSQASSDKRAEIRKQVWNNLHDQDELVKITMPYNIIPIFKSLDAAIEKLLGLAVIKDTDKVLLSMEKSMKNLRFRLLQEKSAFYLMTHRRSMWVVRVDSPQDSSKFLLRQTANLFVKSKVHPVEHGEVFDVLVVSSIAVSPNGERLGKNDVLGELEYAILSSLGHVSPTTLVVTLVHDSQVVDGITASPNHNLPVDLIVTPTRVIQCEKRNKVSKINWSAFTEDTINKVAVLKSLRYKEWKDGGDVKCQGQTENPAELEEEVPKKPGTKRFRGKNSVSERKESTKSDGRRRKISGKENGEGEGVERRSGGYGGRRTGKFFGRPRRYFNWNRQSGDKEDFKPALYVGDLPKDITVETITEVLASKEVHPSSIVKSKYNTHAFAIFDKDDDVSHQLQSLEGLTIEEKPLKIELSRQTARRLKRQQ